jgi:hypothetical protein
LTKYMNCELLIALKEKIHLMEKATGIANVTGLKLYEDIQRIIGLL